MPSAKSRNALCYSYNQLYNSNKIQIVSLSCGTQARNCQLSIWRMIRVGKANSRCDEVSQFFAKISGLAALPLLAAALWLTSCGSGGGGGSSQPPPPHPDFGLSVSSTPITLDADSSATASVTVTGTNGFTSPVDIEISGLPSGVSVSPAKLQVVPGQSGQLKFTAAAYLSPSTTSLTVTGLSGWLSHTTTMSIAVAPYAGDVSVPRTRYTRTDAATPYFLWNNSHWIVFDPVTNRFFVTDPSANQIIVLNAATQTEIGTITVPGAFSVDETPDHTTLYVGTQIGDVYTIDPVGMKVVHRYLASEIGPNGYKAYSALVLANGKLALLGGQGALPGVDGYSGFAIWSPSDNSLTSFGNGDYANNCTDSSHIFEFTLTGDRTTIVTIAFNSLCTLNTITGQVNSSAPAIGFPVVSTPDGKLFLALQPGGGTPDSLPGQILVLDASTLAQKSSIQLSTDTTSATAMFVSPDSSTVYIGEGDTDTPIVYAYNIATGAQIGWLPNLFLSPIVGGSPSSPVNGPDFQAMDSTGLLAGPMEEGVGFLDTAALRTGPVGTPMDNAYLDPATGPSAGGTQPKFFSGATLAALYFGKNLASSISEIGDRYFEATTPPGPSGPVDVYGVMTDGGLEIFPEAFSYGPTILEATPNYSTAEGGGTGVLYGYGFGPTNNNAIPTDLQVSVGGKQAQITSYYANAYGVESPPFPLQSVSYAIPAGVAVTSSDITVTTESGSATLTNGMSYLPATQRFSLNGAVLAQGVYDPKRDLYYFTDAATIQVFSKSQGQWLTPIPVPASPNGRHRLWGIALSPDSSKLAVSDSGDAMIYLIDPDSGSVQSFPVSAYFAAYRIYPNGLAISDTGDIYFSAYTSGGSGDGFFKLDTATGNVMGYPINASEGKVAITSDNSKVFLNDGGGTVISVDTSTDSVSYATTGPVCCGDYDLTLSADQTTLEATSYLYDASLNAESYLTLNDREALNTTYVYGTALSPDGSLLFQPSTNGIDVFDGELGTLRLRIALPFALSQNYDALVGDGHDNVLIDITGANGNGIAVVDLSSLNEPSPLPYFKYRTEQPHSSELNEPGSFGSRPFNPSARKDSPFILPRSVIKHVSNNDLVRHR
ncbi:MAG: hypothetical protein WBD10_03550 [Acidobacteriaceae bacterium]